MKNKELEIYKGFFNRVENIIKDYENYLNGIYIVELEARA